MSVNAVASNYAVLAMTNFQAQAGLMILQQTLATQAQAGASVLSALPTAAPTPGASLGGSVNTYA